VRDARDLDGERGDGEHRGQHAHSEEYVVGVEAVGVETETLPGYEDGHEERPEDNKATQCVVHDEFVREFGDGNDNSSQIP
jgi:hypothetical protein